MWRWTWVELSRRWRGPSGSWTVDTPRPRGGVPPMVSWCGGWHLSPVASDHRSDCPLLSPTNRRTPHQVAHGHTAHCHGCRSYSFSRWPTTSTRAATYFVPGPFLLCGVCVCEPGPLPFSLDPFFSLLSSPPTRFLLLSSLSLSVPPVPLSFSPVLLYPVTAQLFGTPRGRSTEKASPLPVHCRA